MKTKLFFLATVLLIYRLGYSQIYTGKSSEISFFSHGPIEDIAATSKSAQVMLNAPKGDVAVKVTIKGFVFEKKLMEEHFNEKYMESDKFPYATFTGKIKDTLDYKKDGTYKVSVIGKLNMHGVEKERTISANVTIKGGEITVDTKFMVALKDHNIEIPSLVSQNIAELVAVTVKSSLTEFIQKNK